MLEQILQQSRTKHKEKQFILFTGYLKNSATAVTAMPLSSAYKIVASMATITKRNIVLKCQKWTSVVMPFCVSLTPSYKRAYFKETHDISMSIALTHKKQKTKIKLQSCNRRYLVKKKERNLKTKAWHFVPFYISILFLYFTCCIFPLMM